MLDGAPFDTRDPELMARHQRCRSLLSAYNQSDPTDPEERRRLLDALLGRLGAGAWVEPPFFCDYGENIAIADGAFLNFNCVLLDANPIEIGAGVLIGPAVQIYTASHPLSAADRIRRDGRGPRYVTTARPVVIGEDAWIGGGAILLPGVEIGAGATIGAGAVVTKSVPARVFAAGNPCEVIRALN